MELQQLNNSFYRRWDSMLARCNNKKNNRYYRYGKRGISVEWKTYNEFKNDMFESFLAHIKLNGEKNTTIDRINNDIGYSKNNCRWVTHKENCRNRSTNKKFDFLGELRTLKEISELAGISYRLLWQRIYRDKMGLTHAITKPIGRWYFKKHL